MFNRSFFKYDSLTQQRTPSALTPGLPALTYLHLEKNRFSTFPKDAFKLVPSLLALHLENNAITRLEADALASVEGLRALYLTGNAISNVSPRAVDQARDLDTLHLGGNKLKEVPTDALSKLGHLRDLRLSGNPIRWIGPSAFQPVASSLKELYLDNMALEKVSCGHDTPQIHSRSIHDCESCRCLSTLWQAWVPA